MYFEAVCIDSVGHVQDIKTARGNYDIMVDGGFTGNFPVGLFDSVGDDIHNNSLQSANHWIDDSTPMNKLTTIAREKVLLRCRWRNSMITSGRSTTM